MYLDAKVENKKTKNAYPVGESATKVGNSVLTTQTRSLDRLEWNRW